MPDDPDYYETLQVSPRAAPYVIDAAYKNLAHKYHPDVNRNPDAHQRMAELNRAMEVLRDPGRRAEYDRRMIRLLAQRAKAPRSPAVIFWMYQRARYSIRVRESLRRLSLPWLVFVGGLLVALVGVAMMLRQYVWDSGGDRQSSTQLEGLLGLDRPADSFRAEGVQPEASPPAQAGVPLPPTPTPPASPGPTASMSPQALAAVRDDARPSAGGGAGPAAPTPTPAPVVIAPPAPDTAPASTPPPATPAPQTPTPTPTAATCAAGGPPQISETGNQVRFMYGDGAAHFEFEGRRVTRKTQGQREVPGVIQPPHRGKIVETDQAHDAISQGTGYDALPDIIGHVVDELIRAATGPTQLPHDLRMLSMGLSWG